MNDIAYQAAKALVARGFRVFPIKPETKRPRIKDWKALASRDDAQLRDWFVVPTRGQPPRVGIALDEHHLAIDIDDKPGRDGFAALADLPDLPDTYEQGTPSGGEHLIYLVPDGVRFKNQINTPAKGLDLKTLGGYVIGADGDGYVVQRDGPLAVLPDAWVSLLKEAGAERADAASRASRAPVAADAVDARSLEILNTLGPDYYEDRDNWIRAMMAWKDKFAEAGFDSFDAWSSQASNYDADECLRQWESIEDRGDKPRVSMGTLIKWAKDEGWEDNEPDADAAMGVLRGLVRVPAVDLQGQLDARFNPMPVGRLPDLKTTGTGAPSSAQVVTRNNTLELLKHTGVSLKMNLLTGAVDFFLDGIDAEPDRMQDALRSYMWRHAVRVDIGNRKMLDEELNAIAQLNKYHPVEDWFNSLEWDGYNHIGDLAKTLEGDDADVTELYVRRWLVAGVQAVCGWRDPQQIRNCLVLAGRQRVGKTTWFRVLAPLGSFVEGAGLNQNGAAVSPDSIREATAGTICELGEIDTTFSRVGIGALKAFITKTHDVYRIPYDVAARKVPRTTLFCGTVNDTQFLHDDTGSSRFMPLVVTRANFRHGIDISKIWAQAAALWRAGEAWNLTDVEYMRQEARSDTFTENSSMYEALCEACDAAGDGFVAITAMKVYEALTGKKGATASPIHRREMTKAIERFTGQGPKKISGVKRAYLLPDCPAFRGHGVAVNSKGN